MKQQFIIIMATWNRCQYLKAAVASISNQTYPDWRLIIVNDGSTDDTSEYLSTITDERIISYNSLENLGVNASRNKALSIIKDNNITGYITLLDDDDTFFPACFFKIDKLITKHPGYYWYTANCVQASGEMISKIKNYGEASYIYDYMYGKRIKGDLTHFIHTEAIGNCRFTTVFKNSEEWYFFSGISYLHNMYMLNYNAKIVETLPDGLLRRGVNRDQKIAVLTLKINTLKEIVPERFYIKQSISLANMLAKTNQPIRTKKALKEIPIKFRLNYKYLLAYSRYIWSLLRRTEI